MSENKVDNSFIASLRYLATSTLPATGTLVYSQWKQRERWRWDRGWGQPVGASKAASKDRLEKEGHPPRQPEWCVMHCRFALLLNTVCAALPVRATEFCWCRTVDSGQRTAGKRRRGKEGHEKQGPWYFRELGCPEQAGSLDTARIGIHQGRPDPRIRNATHFVKLQNELHCPGTVPYSLMSFSAANMRNNTTTTTRKFCGTLVKIPSTASSMCCPMSQRLRGSVLGRHPTRLHIHASATLVPPLP